MRTNYPEALIVACLVVLATTVFSQPLEQTRQPQALGSATVHRDLAYVPGGHERQKLDLYLPKEGTHLPLIINIHGGAFKMGSKADSVPVEYLAQGYAVASINYRLSQHAKFPAQIEDCKAAVCWLRAHAAEYRLDPEHFAAWGGSAGGNLAALLGTTSDVKELDVGPILEPTPSIPLADNDSVAAPKMLLDSAGKENLVDWGFNGEVSGSIMGVQTFDALAPGLLPEGSPERQWALAQIERTRRTVQTAHDRGMKCFASTDLFVLPRALVNKYRDEICDERGRIDIHRPKTQELFRAMLQETLDRLPDLDGLVIRTGEVYLHNYPYHAASGDVSESKRQGGSAILRGPQSHIEILKILREEVCVKRGKKVLYRTWSFGPNSLHESPEYYLTVTDAIEPHPNLIFSVKHQKGDFHQLTPFNPTLMIGKHPQIIEVQSQREAYGKGAHPYYIGRGVIEGWEEYAWMMKPGEPRGLRDVVAHPLYAGVWIWSRGGGWEGPTIKNGLWCDLNSYVVSQFVRDPSCTETEIFNAFARDHLHLSATDAAKFHELNLLSAQAVLRGQLTTLGVPVNVWWARDHFFEAVDLSGFVKRGLTDKALAEKAESVALWRRIEKLAREIQFADDATREFVITSAAYGRIKYSMVEQAWTILFAGRAGDASGQYDVPKLRAAIARYDALWADWRTLEKEHPACATIYKDVGFEGRPGIGAAVDRYRVSE